MKTNNEETDNAALDKLLSQFYIVACRQNGDLYSLTSMQAISFAFIQHHFLMSCNSDIRKGDHISLSNITLKAFLALLKGHANASMNHHLSISQIEMTHIQSSLSHITAQGLQHKVFLDTVLYFANRGMENLSDMKPGILSHTRTMIKNSSLSETWAQRTIQTMTKNAREVL